MDMVFSDTGDAHGGFYDSNNGLDYHVPVAGGTAAPSPLRVVHVSVEMAPIAKVILKSSGNSLSSWALLLLLDDPALSRCCHHWRRFCPPPRGQAQCQVWVGGYMEQGLPKPQTQNLK